MCRTWVEHWLHFVPDLPSDSQNFVSGLVLPWNLHATQPADGRIADGWPKTKLIFFLCFLSFF